MAEKLEQEVISDLVKTLRKVFPKASMIEISKKTTCMNTSAPTLAIGYSVYVDSLGHNSEDIYTIEQLEFYIRYITFANEEKEKYEESETRAAEETEKRDNS